jgi:F0F1-type ATP synthase membrane subunit b/b'
VGTRVPARRGSPLPVDGHRRVGARRAAAVRTAARSKAPWLSRRAIIRRKRGPHDQGPPVTTVPIDATEGTPIDIIFLVERLESIIANGRRLPLTTNVVVDQAAALGLIDELRVAVPEEVRAAKRINSEGERIIEKAQEEAERIVAKAQEQAAFLIDERGLTQQAEAESRRIVGEAESDAEDVRRGADEYAVNVLVGLEGDVVKTLQSIKKGIDLLDSRRADLRSGDEQGIEPDNGVDDEAFEDVLDDEGQPQPVRR